MKSFFAWHRYERREMDIFRESLTHEIMAYDWTSTNIDRYAENDDDLIFSLMHDSRPHRYKKMSSRALLRSNWKCLPTRPTFRACPQACLLSSI